MSYRNYTDAQLTEYIIESFSTAEVLRKLGLKPAGGNYMTVRIFIQNNKIDVSHWTGRGWNAGKHFKDVGSYSKPHKRKKVLAELRGWKCEVCNLSEWCGKVIPLEIHHIDKDRSHNVDTNFLLCCKNCHAVMHDRT